MPSVARQGDQGSHGNTLLSGSPNVLINGQQVHRQGDIFVCPSHGVSVTIAGSPTVNANGSPVARVGSVGADGSVVILGSPNVNVP